MAKANANADFRLVPLDGVSADPYVTRKAVSNLRRLYGEGMLPPIPGWEGDTVEGYMDILGLNGRPVRVNRNPVTKR